MLSCTEDRSPYVSYNDTAANEIYTLSLHDALPISTSGTRHRHRNIHARRPRGTGRRATTRRTTRRTRLVRSTRHGRRATHHHRRDRKSTRLNSSHVKISYAVFCLKKKKNNK